MDYGPNSRSLVVMKPEHTALIVTGTQNELIPISGYGRIVEKCMVSVGASLGKKADTLARQLGWGPTEATKNVLKLLNQQDRQIWLSRLRYSINHPACNDLEKRCHELMEYSLPEQNAPTQLVAFKSIIMLTTRYPGLRKLLIRFKPLIYFKGSKGAIDTQTAAMNLWNRAGASIHHPKWDFFRHFAAKCISNGELAGIFENTPLDEIGIVPKDGGGIIEKLLHLIVHGGVYEISGLIAIRYLGGVLELPTFWLKEHYNHHQYYAAKLFQTIGKCMEDIGVGCDQSLDPTTEKISDNEAIDILANATLVGVTGWRARIQDLESPRWLSDFLNLTGLLLRPDASKFAPNSCTRAKEFARYSQDLTNVSVTEWADGLFSAANQSPRTVITPAPVESRRSRSRSSRTPVILAPVGSRRSRSRSRSGSPQQIIVPSSRSQRSQRSSRRDQFFVIEDPSELDYNQSRSRSHSPIMVPASGTRSSRHHRSEIVVIHGQGSPERDYNRGRSRSHSPIIVPASDAHSSRHGSQRAALMQKPRESRRSRSRSPKTIIIPAPIEPRRSRSRSPHTIRVSAPVKPRRSRRSRSPQIVITPESTKSRRYRSRSPRPVIIPVPVESRRSRSRSPRTITVTPTQRRRSRSRSPRTVTVDVPRESRRFHNPRTVVMEAPRESKTSRRSRSRSPRTVIISAPKESTRSRSRSPRTITVTPTQRRRSRSRSPRTVTVDAPRESRRSRNPRATVVEAPYESRRSRSPRTIITPPASIVMESGRRSPRTVTVDAPRESRRSRSLRTTVVEAPRESRRSRSPRTIITPPASIIIEGGRSRSRSYPWEGQRRVGTSRQSRSRSPIVVQQPEPRRRRSRSPQRVVVAGPSERTHSSQPIIPTGDDKGSSRGFRYLFGGQSRSPNRIIETGGRRSRPRTQPVDRDEKPLPPLPPLQLPQKQPKRRKAGD